MKVKEFKEVLDSYEDEDEVAVEGEDGELCECSCEDVMVMGRKGNVRVLMIIKG